MTRINHFDLGVKKNKTYYELVDMICISKHMKWKTIFEMHIVKSNTCCRSGMCNDAKGRK